MSHIWGNVRLLQVYDKVSRDTRESCRLISFFAVYRMPREIISRGIYTALGKFSHKVDKTIAILKEMWYTEENLNNIEGVIL